MVVTMIYQPRSDNDRARRSDDLKKKTFSIFCEYSSTKKMYMGRLKKIPPFHPLSILSIGEH